MNKKYSILSNCHLFLHDIKKVNFSIHNPGTSSECLEILIINSDGDSGTIDLFFEPNKKLGSLKPLQKLKKIIVNLGGIKIGGRGK